MKFNIGEIQNKLLFNLLRDFLHFRKYVFNVFYFFYLYNELSFNYVFTVYLCDF